MYQIIYPMTAPVLYAVPMQSSRKNKGSEGYRRKGRKNEGRNKERSLKNNENGKLV